jgi:2TM domain
MTNQVLEQPELRQLAIEQLRKKRGLQAHAIAYFTVNAVLVGIWFVTTPIGFFWPIFLLLGWGIGLVFNIWDVYSPERWSEDRIQREMQRLRRNT